MKLGAARNLDLLDLDDAPSFFFVFCHHRSMDKKLEPLLPLLLVARGRVGGILATLAPSCV